MNIDRRRFLAGLATLPLLSACGDTAETDLPPPTQVSDLKLIAQSWGSSQVTAKIAELLVREQLGLPATTETRSEVDIWGLLERGEVHACVEVWPLRNAAGKAALDAGRVTVLGNRGSGRTAWFVPSYVVDAVPEITTATVREGLLALFQKAGLTQLLTGPSDWVTPSPARMTALGVGSFPVQQQGSEKALLDQIRQAYDARQPFVASLWYPHPIHQAFSLQAVGLPASAGCNVDDADFGCDYYAEPLIKVGWPGLRFANPRLDTFLRAFAPPIDDIIGLLASSDSAEVLARNWIRNNQKTWSTWIPSPGT